MPTVMHEQLETLRAESEGFATSGMVRSTGWVVSKPLPRIAMDSRGGRGWRATRLWSSAGTFTGVPLRRGMVRAVVGVDGEGTIRTPAGSAVMHAHTIVALPGDWPIETTQTTPWARLVWEVDYPALQLAGFAAAFARVLSVKEPLWDLVAAITNVLAPSGDQPRSDEDPFLADALGSTLAAALASAAAPMIASRPSLYAEAVRIVDAHHRDPALNVTSLAQRLSISAPHLHRLFAYEGTSPREAIEERRVATVHALRQRSDGELSESELAARAGFTSVRRMRDAIHRQSAVGAGRA